MTATCIRGCTLPSDKLEALLTAMDEIVKCDNWIYTNCSSYRVILPSILDTNHKHIGAMVMDEAGCLMLVPTR